MDDKKVKYLETVLNYMLEDSEIDLLRDNVELPFFMGIKISHIRYVSPVLKDGFKDYCKNDYGLTEDEIEYLWPIFIERINKIFDSYGYPNIPINESSSISINESLDSDAYYSKIVPLLNKPYMADLYSFDVPVDDWEKIFRMIYGDEVDLYISDSLSFGLDGDIEFIQVALRNPYNKIFTIYYEDKNGDWVEKNYDRKTFEFLSYEDNEGIEFITENYQGVDKFIQFYDYILKDLLDGTEYELVENNYGGTWTEKSVRVSFPFSDWSVYRFKWLEIYRMSMGELSPAEVGAFAFIDIFDYIENNYDLDTQKAKIIVKKYMGELGKMLLPLFKD